MDTTSENNKRIAKNTVFLYLRMLLIMLVGLYTSRVVLQVLGVSDYGIYSVVGGVIGMLGYFNILLSGGTSRFLTVALGKGDKSLLCSTFSTSLSLALISSLIVLLLGETIGLWFVINKLNIPEGRETAAIWVYHCALITSAIAILQNPFTASIISHEKMSVYAYISIFESLAKLGIVYLLLTVSYDKLETYAVLLSLVALVNLAFYAVYCRVSFFECRLRPSIDRTLLGEMFTYSGWNMLGSISSILNNYGINILLNIFFGTIVNASRGIASQVCGLVQQFCGNFQMAARPQITKYYAVGQIQDMTDLIIANARYSAYLVLLLIVPLGMNIEGVLNMWLTEVPQYAASFILLVFLQILFFALDGPVGIGIQAVGKMKLPNILSGIVYISIFPITYIVLKLGGSPITSYVVTILTTPVILFMDVFILRKYTQFDVPLFCRKAIGSTLYVGAVSVLLPILMSFSLSGGVFATLLKLLVDFVYVAVIIFYCGLTSNDRNKVYHILRIKK